MNSNSSEVHINTVTGLIPVDRLGITLFHEHLFLQNLHAYRPHPKAEFTYLEYRPLAIENLTLLREFPYASRDNLVLDDEDTIVWELGQFSEYGGQSIIDVTGWTAGRSPLKLKDLSVRTGINIVMGCGLYRENTFPGWAIIEDEVQISERLVQEITQGIEVADGSTIRPGIIGEVGIERGFGLANRKALGSAARAQVQTGLPLSIHLPGWERYGHEVVDFCEKYGVDPQVLILDHMDPSSSDPEYQLSLAQRGVFLEFDGIGLGLFLYQEKQCPCDDEIARAVIRLLDAGYGNRILLSHDVYLKIQWQRYGGNGYSHLLKSFLPRLKSYGVDDITCRNLVIDNPRQAFTHAAQGRKN
jgi:phosphotriesterase-related protein